MSDRPLVSVIVPVYNVERFLEECVRSIMAQSYHPIEIILVDDGSTDSSGAICDELAGIDDRICVLHNANKGPSEARNRGLSVSKGDYVTFIDSDDVVSPFYIEVLVGAVLTTGVRIASLSGLSSMGENEEACLLIDPASVQSLSVEVVSADEAERLMLYQAIEAGMPLRLYDRDLLGEKPFRPHLLIGEDLVANYRVFHDADEIALIGSHELYAYRQLPSSVVHRQCDHDKASSAEEVARLLYSDIASWYPGLRNAAASRCFSICRAAFAQLPPKSRSDSDLLLDRLALWKIIKQHRKTVLYDHSARKKERIAAGIACGGEVAFSLFCYLARKLGLMR